MQMTSELVTQTKSALQKVLMETLMLGADVRTGDGRLEKILGLIASECPYEDAVAKYSDEKRKSDQVSSKVALTERTIQHELKEMRVTADDAPEIMSNLGAVFDQMFKKLQDKNSDLNKSLENYLKTCSDLQGVRDGSADGINGKISEAVVACVKGFLVGIPAGPAALITGGISAAFVVGGIARAKIIVQREKDQQQQMTNLRQEMENELCKSIGIFIRVQGTQDKFAKHKKLLDAAAHAIESGVGSDRAKDILADVKSLLEYELNPKTRAHLAQNIDIVKKRLIPAVEKESESNKIGGGFTLEDPQPEPEILREKQTKQTAAQAYLDYLKLRVETEEQILAKHSSSPPDLEDKKSGPQNYTTPYQDKINRDLAAQGISLDGQSTVIHSDVVHSVSGVEHSDSTETPLKIHPTERSTLTPDEPARSRGVTIHYAPSAQSESKFIPTQVVNIHSISKPTEAAAPSIENEGIGKQNSTSAPTKNHPKRPLTIHIRKGQRIPEQDQLVGELQSPTTVQIPTAGTPMSPTVLQSPTQVRPIVEPQSPTQIKPELFPRSSSFAVTQPANEVEVKEVPKIITKKSPPHYGFFTPGKPKKNLQKAGSLLLPGGAIIGGLVTAHFAQQGNLEAMIIAAAVTAILMIIGAVLLKKSLNNELQEEMDHWKNSKQLPKPTAIEPQSLMVGH